MEEVANQLFCLFWFVITGIVIGILFDIFRILRKSFKTADLITYLQDIIFWLLTGGIVLFSIFKFNQGEIRSYIFVGIAFGIFIYMISISKFIIKYAVIIISYMKKMIYYPLHFISSLLQKSVKTPTILLIHKIKEKRKVQIKKVK